jgi:hypothetical protein
MFHGDGEPVMGYIRSLAVPRHLKLYTTALASRLCRYFVKHRRPACRDKKSYLLALTMQ